MKKFILVLFLLCSYVITGCQNNLTSAEFYSTALPSAAIATVSPGSDQSGTNVDLVQVKTAQTPLVTPTAEGFHFAVDANVPSELKDLIITEISETGDADDAGIKVNFGILTGQVDSSNTVAWIYALAAPFATIADSLSFNEVFDLWRSGTITGAGFNTLLVSPETQAVFTSVWGESSHAVRIVPQENMVDTAWENSTTVAILPFDQLNPRWKVLQVDGSSPYDQSFNSKSYALSVYFGWKSSGDNENPSFPAVNSTWTNRDPEKFTSFILTGTTALVRYTAQKMETSGVNYPADKIGELLSSADITHISNEVPFDPECPPADPVRTEMRFCSDPKYIELLKTIGVDVVELTGNHLLDWGPQPFLYTLDLYHQENIPYYGGGKDLEEATRPYLIEHNGNRLALFGCNRSGPDNDWAAKDTPGSAPCDLDAMEAQIKSLLQQGYLPIVTFQHYEVDDFMPMSITSQEFQRVSAAGAVIVSGSQAHFPHGFAFIGNNFIHYGLGNLFFDQMFTYNRREFIDRHIFYAGKYLGVDLITTELEDYAQPRLMNSDERTQMLADYFKASGW